MSHYYNTTGPISPLELVAIKLDSPIASGQDEIYKGLLPQGGQLLISGETNVGKSLLSLEIISSFSTGNPLWGGMQPAYRAKRILYCLAEHQDSVIQKLWRKTQLPLGCEVFLLGPEAISIDRWLVTKGQPNLQATSKFRRWVEGCDLVVWDPLSAFITGEGAEQDSVCMRMVVDTMSTICQSAGATCLVLAHQGKPIMDTFGKEHSRRSYATRGASGTEDSATNVMYLNQAHDSDPSQKAAGGQVYELIVRKYKGDAPEMYRLLRDPNTLTHTLLSADSRNAYNEARKIALNGKLQRLLRSNEGFNWRTGVQILADVEGLPVETLKKYIGNGAGG